MINYQSGKSGVLGRLASGDPEVQDLSSEVGQMYGSIGGALVFGRNSCVNSFL